MKPSLRDLAIADLDKVLSIEQRVHTHPWTRGNFLDALKSDYVCQVYEAQDKMLGYAVLMPAVDEMHLLNISIDTEYQRQGQGAALLDEMLNVARGLNMQRVILEVRPSSMAALGLYRKAGFSELAVRRGYYPAANGREDAMVMECRL